MFDSGFQVDQEAGDDTLWVGLNQSEDHIVPYPKDCTSLTFGDQNGNDEASDLEKRPADNESRGRLSAPRVDMEPWPDLPTLNAALGRDFNEASSLDKARTESAVQLHGESENSSFLDCDWGNIGDFDDFDRLFSNSESLFGGEIVGSGDEFLSTPSDAITGSVQSIPFPPLPFRSQQPYSHASALQFSENLGGSSRPEEKLEAHDRLGVQRKKAEEISKSRVSSNLSEFPHRVGHQTARTKHTLQRPRCQSAHSPKMHDFSNGENIPQVGRSNQPIFAGYGCHAYPQSGHGIPIHPSSVSSVEKMSVVMTREEKIEKLRRRQQMQAMLAIQQQQRRFVPVHDNLVAFAHNPKSQHPDSLASTVVVEEPKFMSPELNVPAVQEQFESAEEKIFYELQDVIEKLDYRIRLCIKDSLFRLAHNAMDRSSMKKNNKHEHENTRKRSAAMATTGTETHTNPIDRTVAHLLFQRPREKCAPPATTEEVSSSPLLFELGEN